MPKVSVLMPAYNVEDYIRECMDSVLSQTLTDIEVICIDDGSKDSTGSILDEYAAEDNRVSVIHKDNTGYGNSMNIGLDNATGEFIGIVETDDFIEKNMFERLYNLAVDKNVDVIKANYYDYFSKKPEKCRKTGTLDIARQYNKVFAPKDNQRVFMVAPCIWSGIYKRDLIKKNDIRFTETPGASYQDTGFAFKIWSCADSVYLTEEAYLHYRRDNENSSVNSRGKAFCICDEYDEIEKFIERRGKAEFEDIKNVVKFNHYRWNYRRLSDDFKHDFLMRIVREFRPLAEEGRIYTAGFDEKRLNELQEILADPEKYYDKSLKSANKSMTKRLMRKIGRFF